MKIYSKISPLISQHLPPSNYSFKKIPKNLGLYASTYGTTLCQQWEPIRMFLFCFGIITTRKPHLNINPSTKKV